MSEPGDRPKVRLRRASVVLPPVTVDSGTPLQSAGPQARVRLQSAAQHIPPASQRLDSRELVQPVTYSTSVKVGSTSVCTAVWLELREPVEPASDSTVVEAATVRLIRAADAVAPELGLTYDKARSGVDGGEVVVALTPTHPVSAADRLDEIARTIATAPGTTAAWRRAG